MNIATIAACIAVLVSLLLPPVASADGMEALTAGVRALPAAVGEVHAITVRRGEKWTAVGMREHVGYETLRRANPRGFASGKVLIAGMHMAEPLTDIGIVMNIPELTLFYYQDGQALYWYPVSVGMVQPRWHTVTGNFHVGGKEEHPYWERPPYVGGGIMPPGPNNPLGNHLIRLSIPYYGLHGTNDPTTIGKMISHGCIRMFPPHIKQLFGLIQVGDPLILTYETVKVGRQGSAVYIVTYPDIYRKGTNTLASARARLDLYGLAGAVSDATLKTQLARTDGIARPLLGSNTPVQVNGIPLDSPIGPTVRDGVTYLPLPPLAHALGAEVVGDTVTYQGRTVTFTAGQGGVFYALDTLFVPVRACVEGLGGRVIPGPTLKITLP